MIKKFKNKKKVHNQGNTYIMVVATLSFLAVLVAAMLVAVALCYRLKAYDINARDNFYYLEQAMDEIYAGVGADAMKHLNTAYDDTIEVLVYYDAASQSYVTMEDKDANEILKNTFISLVTSDTNYSYDIDALTGEVKVVQHLNSFLSNKYDSTNNPEGVKLSIDNVQVTNDDLTIVNLVLKREAIYSTVNTRKGADAAAGDTFVQTITTDLVIGKPEFEVKFNTIDSNLSELYGFAFVADQGIEIGNATTSVNIVGNVYAAADFYNKEYNEEYSNNGTAKDTSDDIGINKVTDEDKVKYAAVSSYKDTEDRYTAANGKNEKSMYSGIYINGADVVIAADRIIVPGTIAAFNGSNLTIFGSSKSYNAASEIWADSIVLGGYSFLKDKKTEELQGATANIRANAYIYDDLEINAKAAEFVMLGDYYGYNYASLDNREYTSVCVDANGGRKFSSSVKDKALRDGALIDGQAHYNSSAIIVNGEDSSLDLSGVNNMYIAGQAYIETSKTTTEVKTTKDANGKDVEYEVTNKNGENEAVSYDVYDYPDKSSEEVEVEVKVPVTDENGKVQKDADGNIIYQTTEDENGNTVFVTKKEKVTVDDNYTTNSQTVDNKNNLTDTSTDAEKAAAESTNIQDYRTGEAISVKSNQLAYIPNWAVNDTEDGLYLTLPSEARNLSLFKDYFDDVTRIPIIKTVVSGKIYYFFDFSTEATENANITSDVMNQFIEAYAELFEISEGETISEGEVAGLTDITDYDHFQIKMLKIKTDYDKDTDKPLETTSGSYASIYSNSAITVKNGTSFTIKAKSSSIDPLTKARDVINANFAEQDRYAVEASDKRTDYITSADPTEGTAAAQTFANNITTRLQSQYQEVKWTLTPRSSDAKAVQTAHAMDESAITPINYYFYFNKITDSFDDIIHQLDSGYKVWICKDDVHVTDDDFKQGNVKGLIICKGDVTFDTDVKSFEGLIVCGGKIKVQHSMNFTANEEIIKTILRECDESQQYKDDSKNFFEVCEMFQHYQSYYEEVKSDGSVATESTKSISAVQFEDVLSFDNWKKNVD